MADDKGRPRHSWPGIARLCLIYLTMNVSVDVLVWLLNTDSLCGCRGPA
jgi:hypothetical protein